MGRRRSLTVAFPAALAGRAPGTAAAAGRPGDTNAMNERVGTSRARFVRCVAFDGEDPAVYAWHDTEIA